MKVYAAYNVTEFIVALGYKAEVIKEYFLNFYAINNDLTIDLANGKTTIHDGKQPNWKIHLVDTGMHTQTGGRLKRLKKWLDDDEIFLFTYGDGVADLAAHVDDQQVQLVAEVDHVAGDAQPGHVDRRPGLGDVADLGVALAVLVNIGDRDALGPELSVDDGFFPGELRSLGRG